MNVLLISANTETTNMPPLPLGAACVAAALEKAGHETHLVNLMSSGDPESAVRQSIEEYRPDVIGISVRNIDDQNMQAPRFLLPAVKETVAVCRKHSKARIVAGGAGFSIFPEAARKYLGVDAGIAGEGEAAFPGLLAGRPAAPGGLNDFPLPVPDRWIPRGPDRAELRIPVQTRRGCPLDCSYCSTSLIEGRALRRRSLDAIMDWLMNLREAGIRRLYFVDNTFNLPPFYAKDLCRRMIEANLGMDWWAIVYPKWIDEEMVWLMARARCTSVSLGCESGSEPVLRQLNKRFSPKEVREVAGMFRDAGVERRGFLLLGGPGETRESVEESLAFAHSLQLETLKITVGLRIYPGTALAKTAAAEGQIRADDDLLLPRFYLAPELAEWLPERVAAYAVTS
jgi:radical SAM superfamily enzyme YgiQ (UPF0313 family)